MSHRKKEEEERVVYSKRKSARQATRLLFAENSDEEVDELDQEDEDIIDEDIGDGADESVITAGKFFRAPYHIRVYHNIIF